MPDLTDLVSSIERTSASLHADLLAEVRVDHSLDGSDVDTTDRFIADVQKLVAVVRDVNTLAALRLGAWMLVNLQLEAVNVDPHDVDAIIDTLAGSSIPDTLEEISYIWPPFALGRKP